jgi:sporulation protein YunB
VTISKYFEYIIAMIIVANRKKTKRVFKTTIFFILSLLLFFYFRNVACLFVLDIAESKARVLATNAISEAGVTIQAMDSFYGEFFCYEKNSSGDITLITAKPSNINKLYLVAQAETQRVLNKLSDTNISVPIGAFTGSSLLARSGPNVDLKLSIIAVSESAWNSCFYNEGINQTIHRLILRITTKLNILIPLNASDVIITKEFIISENIIIGKVPDSYITGLSQDNIFDLIP